MNKLNKKGFTLIELIVVMAVIAILVLLAAPRFLGYTKDANVTAMKADAKMLSSIALVYNVEQEAWPVVDSDAVTPGLQMKVVTPTVGSALETKVGATVLYELDNAKISNEYKSLKYDIANYALTDNGDVLFVGNAGEGVIGRDDTAHFTNEQ